MDDAQALRARFDRLREERARLADVVAGYRAVRNSRFARLADLTLAIKRAIRKVDEPAGLAVLDLPPLPAACEQTF